MFKYKAYALVSLLLFLVGCGTSGENTAARLLEECPGEITIIYSELGVIKRLSVKCEYNNAEQ